MLHIIKAVKNRNLHLIQDSMQTGRTFETEILRWPSFVFTSRNDASPLPVFVRAYT